MAIGATWGSRSLVESVMLPDTIGLAQQLLSASSGHPGGAAQDLAASADSFADYSDARCALH